MPIVKLTLTRPSTEVEYYSYNNPEYYDMIKSRYEYNTIMTESNNGLTRIIEMNFATQEIFDAWDNDLDRKAFNNIVHEYNMQNGITVVREILS